MSSRNPLSKWQLIALLSVVTCAAVVAGAMARARPPLTDVIIVVQDAVSHKPVFQARLTLQFRDPQSRRGKTISFNAKTNLQGKYKFTFIPMEPIVLFVTDANHQTFGRNFQITRQNQVILVKLRPPQPLR